MNKQGRLGVLDDFSTWVKENRAHVSGKRYAAFCQDLELAQPTGSCWARSVADLTGRYVIAWQARTN
jgi:hypothetical protein